MKKIINGKLYDTETAKRVGAWSNNRSSRDFSSCDEILYRKRTGEFFLHGMGGPMTKYARSCGDNSWSGGEEIIPLSAAKAREWAEEKLDADDYAEIFGMPDEGSDEKETLCIQLPTDLVARLRAGASNAGMSLTAYTETILRNGFNRGNDSIYILYGISMKRPKTALDSIYGVRDLITTASDTERTEIGRFDTKAQALKVAIKHGNGSAVFDDEFVRVHAYVINEMDVDTTGHTDPAEAAIGQEVYISPIK